MKNTLIVLVIVFLLAAGVFANYGYSKNKALKATQENLATTTAAYEQRLALLEEERNNLEDDYKKEKRKNDKFEEDIEEIADTVGDLEKLKKTDKELLQKYSKVYFLNEHYVPKKLETIDSKYVLTGRNPQQFHSDAMSFLEDMFDDAKEDGVDLKVVSSYRSFNTQAIVKANHKMLYGSGANQFSADQGYSEHQLGTTMDLTIPALGADFNNIDQTPAYTWLTENAHEYGFVLSYPKNNTYYIFEPWHWRFVGVDLARYLYKEKKNFYDADQRTIDSYLIKIFD